MQPFLDTLAEDDAHAEVRKDLAKALPASHADVEACHEAVADQAGAVIDAGVYDRVRCFRAPNSRHPKTGLHKCRLTVDELMHLRTDAILKLAKQPEPFELPAPTYRSDKAGARWTAAAEQVQREADARAERLANGDLPEKLNRATLDFIRDGATTGDRHRLCYSAAANVAELGAPLPLCLALLSEVTLDCGLPAKDVRRAIENGWASVQPGVRDACATFGGEVVAVELPKLTDKPRGGAT